jgi:hypothetical protein
MTNGFALPPFFLSDFGLGVDNTSGIEGEGSEIESTALPNLLIP